MHLVYTFLKICQRISKNKKINFHIRIAFSVLFVMTSFFFFWTDVEIIVFTLRISATSCSANAAMLASACSGSSMIAGGSAATQAAFGGQIQNEASRGNNFSFQHVTKYILSYILLNFRNIRNNIWKFSKMLQIGSKQQFLHLFFRKTSIYTISCCVNIS